MLVWVGLQSVLTLTSSEEFVWFLVNFKYTPAMHKEGWYYKWTWIIRPSNAYINYKNTASRKRRNWGSLYSGCMERDQRKNRLGLGTFSPSVTETGHLWAAAKWTHSHLLWNGQTSGIGAYGWECVNRTTGHNRQQKYVPPDTTCNRNLCLFPGESKIFTCLMLPWHTALSFHPYAKQSLLLQQCVCLCQFANKLTKQKAVEE